MNIAALFLKMRFSLLYLKPNMGFTFRETRNASKRGTLRNRSRFWSALSARTIVTKFPWYRSQLHRRSSVGHHLQLTPTTSSDAGFRAEVIASRG